MLYFTMQNGLDAAKPMLPKVPPRPPARPPLEACKSITGLKIPLGPAKSRSIYFFSAPKPSKRAPRGLWALILQLVELMMLFLSHLVAILHPKRRPWDLKNKDFV